MLEYQDARRVKAPPGLPQAAPDAHKGRFGSVLILAGSRGMSGAAGLAGAAALRSGAGIARVVSPREVQPIVASYEPCYMTYPADQDEDGIVTFEGARKALERFLPEADFLTVGPGLGRSSGVGELIGWILKELSIPTLLDADALNHLAGRTELLRDLNRPVIITPHPGEFARLVGRPVAEIQADRERQAHSLASVSESLIVVLKGAGTVVADGRRIYVNESGNPGMATAGSGDVLAGVISGLAAKRLPPFEAACLGAYAHGLAGDIARDQDGEVGMIAGDVVDALPDAFQHLSG